LIEKYLEEKMTKQEQAKELYANQYNCAQSVFGVFCQENGLENEIAFKLANGFGGGIRAGELCGALSGAIMVIGLKCGFFKEKDLEQKAYCNRKAYEFYEKFKQANGTVLCREILGADIACPEDHNIPAVKELHKIICPDIVAGAVTILESMEFD
jgi:C_GCAxxG_C_C family probable redox protein